MSPACLPTITSQVFVCLFVYMYVTTSEFILTRFTVKSPLPRWLETKGRKLGADTIATGVVLPSPVNPMCLQKLTLACVSSPDNEMRHRPSPIQCMQADTLMCADEEFCIILLAYV